MIEAQKQYVREQDARGFKAGDRVRVLRVAADKELGWGVGWVAPMDEAVGTICEVYYVGGDAGLSLIIPGGRYNFPHFVLELVEPEGHTDLMLLL
jgi:hypothetical protein